jgi:hypothetical protein
MQAGALDEVRWLTPVVHCGYSAWKYEPPETSGAKLPPGWEYSLNRVHITGAVMQYPRKALLKPGPVRTLVFLWYGDKDKGVRLFYQRLGLELGNDFANEFGIRTEEPELPMESYPEDSGYSIEFYRSISEMMTHVFDVQNLGEIGEQILIDANREGKQKQ